jgi:hypothetical protein
MDKFGEELESFFANKTAIMSPETAKAYETNKLAPFY